MDFHFISPCGAKLYEVTEVKMEQNELQRTLMAILFAAGEPVAASRLSETLAVLGYASADSSRTARMAVSTSSSVLKYEKLKRTAPCCLVPSASCIRGAQCAPGLVAIP